MQRLDEWPWADAETRVGAVEVYNDGAFNSGLDIVGFGDVVLLCVMVLRYGSDGPDKRPERTGHGDRGRRSKQ